VLRSCEVISPALERHGSRVSGEVDVSAIVHHGGRKIRSAARDAKHIVQRDRPAWRT
jgi:hypothetical protein